MTLKSTHINSPHSGFREEWKYHSLWILLYGIFYSPITLSRTNISWCLCVRWVQSNWFPRKFIRLPGGVATSCEFYLFKFHNRFHWREIQFTVCIPQYWWQPNTMPHLVWNDICNAWIANTKTYQQLHFNAFPQLKFPFYTFVTHFFRFFFFFYCVYFCS